MQRSLSIPANALETMDEIKAINAMARIAKREQQARMKREAVKNIIWLTIGFGSCFSLLLFI